MVNCVATQNTLAADYAALGSWIGLATGNPGTGTTPSNEATGGSPAYARVQTSWTAGTTGVQNGSAVTINVAAATYTYMILASAATVATTNMVDNVAITSVVMGAQGQIVVTPTFTQT
jgi:hypothetical protein